MMTDVEAILAAQQEAVDALVERVEVLEGLVGKLRDSRGQ